MFDNKKACWPVLLDMGKMRMKPRKSNYEILENNKICTISFSVFSSYLVHRRLLSSKGSFAGIRASKATWSQVQWSKCYVLLVLLARSTIASQERIIFTSIKMFKSWKRECKFATHRLVIFNSNLCLKFTALPFDFLSFTQIRFWFFQILKLRNEWLIFVKCMHFETMPPPSVERFPKSPL